MTNPARISYVIIAVLLALVGLLHLATLALTTLFGYFALRQFSFGRSKALGVALYLIAVGAVGYGLFYFSRQAYIALPRIAETTIPAVVGYAEKQGLELPFTDYASLKTLALNGVKEEFANVGRYARRTIFEFAMLLVGLVVSIGLFLNATWQREGDPHAVKDSLYSLVSQEVAIRFRTFYRSFATLIVGVAFTLSPRTALFALIFLVVIHKLEYFLNSKIIGDRIKNPMWLTLLGLVLGEKLMGIPGMILAPVVLHYITVEASKNKITDLARNETDSRKAA